MRLSDMGPTREGIAIGHLKHQGRRYCSCSFGVTSWVGGLVIHLARLTSMLLTRHRPLETGVFSSPIASRWRRRGIPN